MQKKNPEHMGQSRLKFKSSHSYFVSVQHAVKQLQKGFLYYLNPEARKFNRLRKIEDDANPLEGHFPVFAIGSGEAKKFSVGLSFLAYPPLVKLLEAAEREFGFDQPGVLVIPCEANELQRILLTKKNR